MICAPPIVTLLLVRNRASSSCLGNDSSSRWLSFQQFDYLLDTNMVGNLFVDISLLLHCIIATNLQSLQLMILWARKGTDRCLGLDLVSLSTPTQKPLDQSWYPTQTESSTFCCFKQGFPLVSRFDQELLIQYLQNVVQRLWCLLSGTRLNKIDWRSSPWYF